MAQRPKKAIDQNQIDLEKAIAEKKAAAVIRTLNVALETAELFLPKQKKHIDRIQVGLKMLRKFL